MDMKHILPNVLLEATRLTRGGRLTEATAALQRMFGGQAAPGSAKAQAKRGPPTIDGVIEAAETAEARPAPEAKPAHQEGPMPGAGLGRRLFGIAEGMVQPEMQETLRGFLDQIGHGEIQLPGGAPAPLFPTPAPVVVPEGAQFLAATFSNQTGSRPYKLYVPSGYRPGWSIPLVVMLHGCTQSPDDFAIGTGMNGAAEERTCLVAYPGQISSANLQKCWNWFSEEDQRRDGGEPSLISGITREVMRGYAVDPRRVYVAGLSAGGAAAAVMGDAYPDLYAAIGVHSGLPCGAARDMPSAFAAMRQGGGAHRAADVPRSGARRRVIPTIVFHGDRDTTVHPRNGDAVVAQSASASALRAHVEEGRVPGGHAYSRTLHLDANGKAVIEQWVVHGAGHGWFGGNQAGSYTDPRGPDATREMLRFFLEHRHPAPARGV